MDEKREETVGVEAESQEPPVAAGQGWPELRGLAARGGEGGLVPEHPRHVRKANAVEIPVDDAGLVDLGQGVDGYVQGTEVTEFGAELTGIRGPRGHENHLEILARDGLEDERLAEDGLERAGAHEARVDPQEPPNRPCIVVPPRAIKGHGGECPAVSGVGATEGGQDPRPPGGPGDEGRGDAPSVGERPASVFPGLVFGGDPELVKALRRVRPSLEVVERKDREIPVAALRQRGHLGGQERANHRRGAPAARPGVGAKRPTSSCSGIEKADGSGARRPPPREAREENAPRHRAGGVTVGPAQGQEDGDAGGVAGEEAQAGEESGHDREPCGMVRVARLPAGEETAKESGVGCAPMLEIGERDPPSHRRSGRGRKRKAPTKG